MSVQSQIDNLLQKQKDSLRNSINYTNESRHLSNGIINELDVQYEKLTKIDNLNNKIDNELIVADDQLNQISCWCGLFRKNKKKKIKLHKNTTINNNKSTIDNSTIDSKSKNTVAPKDTDISDELTIISSNLTNLKKDALLIGNELDNHNIFIDKINNDIYINDAFINKTIIKTTNIIKSM